MLCPENAFWLLLRERYSPLFPLIRIPFLDRYPAYGQHSPQEAILLPETNCCAIFHKLFLKGKRSREAQALNPKKYFRWPERSGVPAGQLSGNNLVN